MQNQYPKNFTGFNTTKKLNQIIFIKNLIFFFYAHINPIVVFLKLILLLIQFDWQLDVDQKNSHSLVSYLILIRFCTLSAQTDSPKPTLVSIRSYSYH